MRLNSTRKLLTGVVGAAALLFGSSLEAQSTFEITAPANIAATVEAVPGLWGANAGGSTVTGNIVLAEDGVVGMAGNGALGTEFDGCEELTNAADLAGNIGLIDGSFVCNSFASNVKAAGVTGVIVCPNDAYDFNVNPRGASKEMFTDLPVWSVDRATCESIKVQLANGATVTATYTRVCEQDIPENAVWGMNGEGTFEVEGAGWEVIGDGWKWSADAYCADGAYNSTFGWARTQTACNGAYIFDSDFLDNQGIPGPPFGTGDCPADCPSTLTSPVISLTGAPGTRYAIQFDQALRQFQSTHRLIFSADAGTTWDTIVINDQYPVNSNHIAETVVVPLCGVDGAAQLQFRFDMVGNYYYWVVDDVYVIEENRVDVRGNENFYATVPSYKTPMGQTDFHPFLIDVENYGNGDATGVSVLAEVFDANGVIYTATKEFGDIPACFLDENDVFEESYDLTGLDMGFYGTSYTTNSPDNTTEPQDPPTVSWEVTADQFSKVATEAEVGSNYFGSFGSASIAYLTHGSHYYVKNDMEILSMRTGIASQSTIDGIEWEASVDVVIYEWDDANGDGVVTPDERVEIGSGFIEKSFADTDNRDFEVDIFPTDGDLEEIFVNGGTDILVAVHLSSIDPPDYGLRFMAADSDDERSYSYGAMSLASDSLGMPRYGSFFSSGSAFDDIDSRNFNFASNFASYTPITVRNVVSNEEVNETIGIKAYPNPASDILNIDLNLEARSEIVQVELTDVNGRIATAQYFDAGQNQTLQVNLAGVASGVYVAKVRTDFGINTQKVIVVK